VRQRNSIASSNLKMQRTRTDSSANRLRSNSNLTSGSMLDEEEVVHPVEPRARTAMLPPVLVCALQSTNCAASQLIRPQAKKVDEHPVVWLNFEEDCIITSCKSGESTFSPPQSPHVQQALHVLCEVCAVRLVLALRAGTTASRRTQTHMLTLLNSMLS
jgi:hypothetical protein